MLIRASAWAIRNPIPPIVLFLVLTLAGILSYIMLPINNMPNIVIPLVNVTITQPGASPEEMETQVTRKVESALGGLQGIKNISSSISEGNSVTTVEFHLETDFDRAVDDSRDAIANIRDDLPRSILEPLVQRLEVEGAPILTYSIADRTMTAEELSWFVDDTISREIQSIRGIAKVERGGGVTHEITVTVNPERLNFYGISASELSRQLVGMNVDLPGGRVKINNNEYTLRTTGSAKTVEDLSNLKLRFSNNVQIKLSDIATITDGGAEPRRVSQLDGRDVVSLLIYRSKSASEVDVAKKVEKRIDEIKEKFPNVDIKPLFSMVEFTLTSFHSSVYAFVEGTFLTVLVVWFFLRDNRATWIAAIAIPLSIIPTFFVMHFLGFTLNGVSLLAMSLVSGVLVDDAIVEIENIHRHIKRGSKPFVAALEASNEIGMAVVATTSVICAVFFPVSFMPGIPGLYFKQFGITVAVAAFFSLIVARLITPLLAAYFIQEAPEHSERKRSQIMRRYHVFIHWTLGNRKKTLLVAILVMIGSFMLVPLIPAGFIPYDDYSESRLTVELPRGSTIPQTMQKTDEVRAILAKRPEVKYTLVSIDADSTGANFAQLYVKLVKKNERDLSQRDFERDTIHELKKVSDAKIQYSNPQGMKDITITLTGDNAESLERSAYQLEKEMRALPSLMSVTTDESPKQPEIKIAPNFEKMAELGITVEQIGDILRITTVGDIEANLAKFNYGNRQIPIRVRLPDSNHSSLDILKNMRLPTTGGATVPLSAVADISFSEGPTKIKRYNRKRTITVEANLNDASLGQAVEQVYALPAITSLPKDVEVQKTGDAEVMAELFAGFGIAIVAGLLLVYSVQVLLYRNWLHPLSRMVALPLSVGGAFLLLLITGTELSLPAIIGLLMLMGISDKNSILLVDYALEEIRSGVPRKKALIDACMIRARPIIMTSLAMLAGMMPIAVGFSMDSAFRAPMAIAVIGGLISSTMLSLIFVPVAFSFIDDFSNWITPKMARFVNKPEKF
jgi:hydrophobe/amphiphile efflux-1 (HAE1) family protein